jgi:ABC-type branched-subunit amino acid transport system ATPase component/branched-subunit amino acid ABC-type transport system permease component
MEKFLNLTASGLMSGAIYSLIATGLTLSYSATGIFNLGYGAVAFTTAFVYYELHTGLGWPVVPAAVVALLVFAPLLGLGLDRLIFRRLAQAGDAAKIMATVGILVALPALAKWVVELLVDVGGYTLPLGNDVYVTPGLGPSPKTTWELPGGVVFDSNQLIVLVAAVVSAAGLWVLLRRTRLGLTMRAVVDRPALARLRGVDEGRTSAQAWVLGTMLAGLAGVVGAPVFNSLDPATYTYITFVAVAAAVLGGLRSIPVVFAGGLAIGAVQNLVAGYATFAEGIREFNASVPFALLFVGLVVLNRDRSRRAGSVSDEVVRPDEGDDGRPAWRRLLPGAIGAGILLVYLFAVADDFWLSLTTRGLAFSLVFLSFVIVAGMGGMVSLAQTAFVTAAALTAGLLVDRYDAPFLLALAGGVAVAVVLGAAVALPALRLGGLSLALATLALAYVGEKVLFSWQWLGNGQAGWALPRPTLGPLDLADDRTLAVVLLVLVALVTLVIHNIDRSPTGRAITAVRTAEVAAATSGASPTKVKLTLFALSAAVAALGGVLVATVDQRATGTTFPAFLGLVWLAAVVLWGVRRPAGAILAGLTTTLFPALLANGFQWPSWVPEALSWGGTESTQVANILFGLGAIQLAKDPDGILSVVAAAGRARRRRRAEPADVADRLGAEEESSTAAQVAVHEHRLEELGIVSDGGAEATAPAKADAEGDMASRVARASRVGDGDGDPDRAGGDGDKGDGDGAQALGAGRAESGAVALSLRGVRAAYGDVNVLYGIDLDLREGSVTALVGGNGAGKSTLCSVIAGLLAPTAGTVMLDGADVTDLQAHERARQGILLAPESRGIFPALSVEENLALHLTASDQRQRVYERFPALGERRQVPAGSLSGGEQQMLTLAPLLVAPPTVLVADEPTLGLAPRVVGELLDVLGELRAAGVTLLLVEEKARTVLDVADQVVFFELGHVMWSGPRAAVDDDHLAATYLGGAGTPT